MIAAIKKAFDSFYKQFVLMNDTPQHIAIGFGIGFFLGIFPFTGVVAAVATACFFRLNKTAAVLGALLANTWLSFVVFGIAIQMTCLCLGMSGQDMQLKFANLIKNFHWIDLWDTSLLKIIGIVVLAYLIVSIILSFLAYGICLAVIYWKKRP